MFFIFSFGSFSRHRAYFRILYPSPSKMCNITVYVKILKKKSNYLKVEKVKHGHVVKKLLSFVILKEFVVKTW